MLITSYLLLTLCNLDDEYRSPYGVCEPGSVDCLQFRWCHWNFPEITPPPDQHLSWISFLILVDDERRSPSGTCGSGLVGCLQLRWNHWNFQELAPSLRQCFFWITFLDQGCFLALSLELWNTGTQDLTYFIRSIATDTLICFGVLICLYTLFPF